MGSQVQKQAALLGLTKLRLTTLYAQPRSFRPTFKRRFPDLADIIRDYINFRDPSFIQDNSGLKNTSFYFLSQKTEIYVEIFNKNTEIFGRGELPQDNVDKINIYCGNEEDIRGIAQAVTRGENRVKFLAHLDWIKIKGKFKVNKDDCIAEWKKWLSLLSATTLSSMPASPPPTMKRKTALILERFCNIATIVSFIGVSIIFVVLGVKWLPVSNWETTFWLIFLISLFAAFGWMIPGTVFSSKKTKAEQFIMEQQLLSEEKQQENTQTPPISNQSSTITGLSEHKPVIQPTATAFCNQCGFRNPLGTLFCQSCGSAIESRI